MQPILSIIIPVYNVEEYLPQCLDSVFSQNVENMEVICVNDGSPDNCDEILNTYKHTHSNLIVVDRENGGLIAARNTGYAVAKGKYIYYLDSDDYLLNNALGRMIHFCESNALDLGLFNSMNSTGKNYYSLSKQIEISDGKSHYKKFYRNNAFFPPSVQWLYLYRKDFLDENNIHFPPDNKQEDEPFTVKAYFHANRVGLLNINIIYHRIMREGSITEKAGMPHLIDARKAWKDLFYYLKRHNCNDKEFFIKIFSLYVNTIVKLRSFFREELVSFFNKEDKNVMRKCAVNFMLFKYYFYFNVSSSFLDWYENKSKKSIIKKILNKLIYVYYIFFVKHE